MNDLSKILWSPHQETCRRLCIRVSCIYSCDVYKNCMSIKSNAIRSDGIPPKFIKIVAKTISVPKSKSKKITDRYPSCLSFPKYAYYINLSNNS